MLKKIIRKFSPNPLDQIIKKAQKNRDKRFLLFWNRGLGDIALGLYAMVQKIKESIPDSEITFLIRKDLAQGFSFLEGVKVIRAPDWKRGERYCGQAEIKRLGLDRKKYDIVIEWPDPTYWVKWQLGNVVPKLYWKKEFERPLDEMGLEKKQKYIACQPLCETNYGLWRNLPPASWKLLFSRLAEKKEGVILLGKEPTPKFEGDNIIDLRGKTDLYTLLSLLQKKIKCLIVPDSGILSMTYYLYRSFPIKVISLWADPNHGVLKQNIFSPNPELIHIPLVEEKKDLSALDINKILCHL